MSIIKIAINNLQRRKVKMLFLMFGLVVGTATAIGIISIIQAMELELGNRIDEFGANAVIFPRTENVDLKYGLDTISDVNLDTAKLTMEDIPLIYKSSVAEYINIVSPKLIGAVQSENKKVLIAGVETKSEFTQKPWFSLESQESQGDLALLDLPYDRLILGHSAARSLNIGTGDELTLDNQTFYVFGVLNPVGGEEDGLIYLNLTAAQTLLDKQGELSMIEISAYCNNCPIEEIAMGIEDIMDNGRVIPLRQAALYREETIDNFKAFGLALAGIVLLIAGMIVLVSMLSLVNERTREIGIFRAIGFRKVHVLAIIYAEVGIVSLAGGLLGFFAGNGAARYAGPYLAQIQGEIPFSYEFLLPAIALSVGLAIATSSYPAIKASKLDPADALRFI